MDIAILLKKPPSGLNKLAFINSVTSKIEKKMGRPADIVILNHASPALKQQVAKYGKLLFEKKHGLASKFILDTITAYFDYLEILRFFYARAIQKRN